MGTSVSEADLSAIWDRTAGRCHLCHQRAGRVTDYGDKWELDHLKARSKGGASDPSNLLVAHVSCNRRRQDRPAEEIRREHGVRGKPLSRKARRRRRYAWSLAAAGMLIGTAFGGLPLGGALCLLGAAIGMVSA